MNKKTARQRQITHCESLSLWNYTLSPGLLYSLKNKIKQRKVGLMEKLQS